jgi:hypothetical protein
MLEHQGLVESDSSIPDNLKYEGSTIHFVNEIRIPENETGNFYEIEFLNNFMEFRYLNVFCPFHVENDKNFSFSLIINSSQAESQDWEKRVNEAIEAINSDSSLVKEDISDIVIDQPNSEKSFKLEEKGSMVFIINKPKLLNIFCETEIIHSIYVVKENNEKLLWIDEIVSKMNYDFKGEFEKIYIKVKEGSIPVTHVLKFSTLNILLKLNLDTSVDQATSLLTNFIGLMLIGFYNIYKKIRENCAKKKKTRKISGHTPHVQFNDKDEEKGQKDALPKSELQKKNSSNYSEFNETNSKSNSNSNNNSDQNEYRFSNRNFQLPEALQKRYLYLTIGTNFKKLVKKWYKHI